jgi:hypothetical protein
MACTCTSRAWSCGGSRCARWNQACKTKSKACSHALSFSVSGWWGKERERATVKDKEGVHIPLNSNVCVCVVSVCVSCVFVCVCACVWGCVCVCVHTGINEARLASRLRKLTPRDGPSGPSLLALHSPSRANGAA